MEKELFALLRMGLGTSIPEKEDQRPFAALTADQWAQLGEMALEQGVLGIFVDGVERLGDSSTEATQTLSKRQKLEWIGVVLQNYEAGNMKQLVVIDTIQKLWAESGIRMMLMKGMAMGTYYPEPKHRSPGDIDCYLFNEDDNENLLRTQADAYKKGNDLAQSWADNVDEGWYKHSQIHYQGELIENHQYFVHTREGKSSKRLNQVLVDSLKDAEFNRLPGTGALLPPPMFNALFLTYHAMTHFLEEGLKLKQVLDWAMFLKRDGDKVDWQAFYGICDKFHMRRFADVCTDIAVNYLYVNLNDNRISAKSPYTEKVLKSTFYDKDYVFSSGQSGWANRWHIVRNLIKYRWKYHQIYQHSVIRQLWWYAIGYVFKTE